MHTGPRTKNLQWLTRHWEQKTYLSIALFPISLLYCGLMQLRRKLYQAGILHSVKLPVPVVVVGNITVGGTGKTPLVLWLADFLSQSGYRPGIVSRGYGGSARDWPQLVSKDSDPAQAGDEPVLLARRCDCPVIIDPMRPRGARKLISEYGCTAVISDDGLQHYALGRTMEIAVVDARRRFGNGFCLPAGPLREPLARLRSVQLRVANGEPQNGELGMTLVATGLINLKDPAKQTAMGAYREQTIHAVAGIGNPQRFFGQLREQGLKIREHAFPDHHTFRASDITFNDDKAVIMTEKDAVKCERLVDRLPAAGEHYWYLQISARPVPEVGQLVLKNLLEAKNNG